MTDLEYERLDDKQCEWLSRQPVCDYCDNPVTTYIYHKIEGRNICADCLSGFIEINDEWEK